jgi:hypothetical protein
MRFLALAVLLVATARAEVVQTVPPDRVSLAVKGGADYTTFQNQYERDAAEQSLANVYLPQVELYMKSVVACAGYLSNGTSQASVIYPRLDAVNQYRGGMLRGNTWQVTNGGRHYQIENYQMQHAQACSTGSGKYDCAESALLTDTIKTLLNIAVVNGACVKLPTRSIPHYASSLVGLAKGSIVFLALDAASEAALHAAEAAHAAGMCGAEPSPIGVQAAQAAYIALASTPEEAHFRTPQPFKGGCDPSWYTAECCAWKALEHREYTAWAHAQRLGRWGEADCFGARHAHMHVCANWYGAYTIRMPTCRFGDYPDDTPSTTCQDYLANPVP